MILPEWQQVEHCPECEGCLDDEDLRDMQTLVEQIARGLNDIWSALNILVETVECWKPLAAKLIGDDEDKPLGRFRAALDNVPAFEPIKDLLPRYECDAAEVHRFCVSHSDEYPRLI